ncbi:TPA: helix-turn-helix transcriptional regulator [Enterococcus faecium]|uniref:helix-turn-helix transcriptional regulator n=1 Tax=Enterococcus faecium TaxID=1352 RepID=UPI0015C4E81E|nr:helix-turn-helix transcriptional regulator [Enterococcus faecium]EMF0353965.1 helix-turn-helix transcriptional regulator [Enterococcus faecium]MDW7854066.1 helix-turn-helix transcriptional regulator [Enterococcus faecium]
MQKYRIEANLSQKELAELMAASRNTIANWENDRNKPDYDGIQALCHILSIPVQELFSMDNDKAVSPQ